jgi:hypothetical protein
VRKPPLPQSQSQTPRPSTQQFNATPRFNVPSTPRPNPSQTLSASTPSTTRYLPRAQSLYNRDEIREASLSSQDTPHDSIEVVENEVNLEYLTRDDDCHSEPEPKRRRLSTSPALLDEDHEQAEGDSNYEGLPDSSISILSSPPTPRPTVSSSVQRFVTSTPIPAAPQTAQNTNHTFLKPPRFRPPDASEQTQTDPLPAQFSPHRRGQKYVPGGLAAEVRDWLVNLESTVPGSAALKDKDGSWAVQVMVHELSGGGRAGMTLVRGGQKPSDFEGRMNDTWRVVQIILAGEGTAIGLQRRTKVEVGSVVGIRGPLWEAVIDGEKWGVAVDWQVIT